MKVCQPFAVFHRISLTKILTLIFVFNFQVISNGQEKLENEGFAKKCNFKHYSVSTTDSMVDHCSVNLWLNRTYYIDDFVFFVKYKDILTPESGFVMKCHGNPLCEEDSDKLLISFSQVPQAFQIDTVYYFYEGKFFGSGVFYQGLLIEGYGIVSGNSGYERMVNKVDNNITGEWEIKDGVIIKQRLRNYRVEVETSFEKSGKIIAEGTVTDGVKTGSFVTESVNYIVQTFKNDTLHGETTYYFPKYGWIDTADFVKINYQNGIKHGKTYGSHKDIVLADGEFDNGNPWNGKIFSIEKSHTYVVSSWENGRLISENTYDRLFLPKKNDSIPIDATNNFSQNGLQIRKSGEMTYYYNKDNNLMYHTLEDKMVFLNFGFNSFLDVDGKLSCELNADTEIKGYTDFDVNRYSGSIKYVKNNLIVDSVMIENGKYSKGVIYRGPLFIPESSLLKYYEKIELVSNVLIKVYPKLDLILKYEMQKIDNYSIFDNNFFPANLIEITSLSGQSLYKNHNTCKYFVNIYISDEESYYSLISSQTLDEIKKIKINPVELGQIIKKIQCK
jgi:hypothetical protein